MSAGEWRVTSLHLGNNNMTGALPADLFSATTRFLSTSLSAVDTIDFSENS